MFLKYFQEKTKQKNVLEIRLFKKIISVLCVVVVCGGCSENPEKAILSEEQMAEVMYGYQMAEGLKDQTEKGDRLTLLEYRQAVFHQHGITENDFNNSLIYYSRRAEQMKNIYARLQQKMSIDMNVSTSGTNAGNPQNADTVFLWRKSDLILTANRGNRYSFEIVPNTKNALGDTLYFSCESNWFYRQGAKQAIASLIMKYDNDSVDVDKIAFNSYEKQTSRIIPLSAKSTLKGITLEIYQNAPWSTTLQLLYLQQMKLFCMKRGKSETLVDKKHSVSSKRK